MGMIAEAVRHMLAAGMTAEAIVAAVADMELHAPKDEAAERRRASDAERKRLKREEEKRLLSLRTTADGADTPSPLDGPPCPSPAPLPEPPLNPPSPSLADADAARVEAPQDVVAQAVELTEWIQARFGNQRIYIAGPAIAWLRSGAIPELDVKPVIERHIASGREPPRASLAMFDRDIAESIRQRTKTITVEEIHGDIASNASRPHRSGPGRDRPLSAHEAFVVGARQWAADRGEV